MAVSPSQRREAEKAAGDERHFVPQGVQATARLGAKLQNATIQAYRAGRQPTVHVNRIFSLLRAHILWGMIVAHLYGIHRTRATMPKLKLSLQADATPSSYKSSLDYIAKLLKLSPEEIKELTKVYDKHVLSVVAGASRKVQKALRTTLQKIQKEGMHKKDGVKLLRKSFAAQGLTPGNSFTLEGIFRTQTALAYSAGQEQTLADPDVAGEHWGYKYVTVGDERVRPEHAGFDGVTLPKGHAFWNHAMPPNGWACRCKAIPLFDKEREVKPKETKVAGKWIQPSVDKGFTFRPGAEFKAPKIKKPKPKPTKKHVRSAEPDQEWFSQLSATEKEAFKDWGSGGYHNIVRETQQGQLTVKDVTHEVDGPPELWDINSPQAQHKEAKRRAEEILEVFDYQYPQAPKFHGESYRNLNNLIPKDIEEFTKEGAEFETEAWSSWTTSEDVAADYADATASGKQWVTFQCKKSTRGMPISHEELKTEAFAWEAEIVVPKGKYRIVKVRKVEPETGPSGYIVEVEEVQ